MISLRLLSLILTGALFAGGCSLEYQELAETLDEQTPSLRMEGVTVVTVEDGVERFRIEAGSLEEYENTFTRQLNRSVFTEYNREGEISAEGLADRISFDTRSDDAVMEGNIRFTSIEDETTVLADYLEWTDAERRLTGSGTGEVVLERENGTRLHGTGFSADFPSRTFRFSGGVAGRYVTGSEEEGGIK